MVKKGKKKGKAGKEKRTVPLQQPKPSNEWETFCFLFSEKRRFLMPIYGYSFVEILVNEGNFWKGGETR